MYEGQSPPIEMENGCVSKFQITPNRIYFASAFERSLSLQLVQPEIMKSYKKKNAPQFAIILNQILFLLSWYYR